MKSLFKVTLGGEHIGNVPTKAAARALLKTRSLSNLRAFKTSPWKSDNVRGSEVIGNQREFEVIKISREAE